MRFVIAMRAPLWHPVAREANEDRFAGEVFDRGSGYAVVCDGMGGEVGGGGQLDVVVERNRQHDAAQVVVAVRPRAVYFEREVDLGVGRAAHHRISQRGRSPTIGRA